MLTRLNNLSFKFKIMGIILLTVIILTLSSLIGFRRVLTDLIVDQTLDSNLEMGYGILDREYPGEWRLENGDLYKGDTLLNENYEIVDYIGDLTGGTATIFAEDTRISTNVQLETGERATGTVAEDAVIEQVIHKGQNFYGEANVAGTPSQTAYTPIEDEDGNIIGMWYVGVSQEYVNTLINESFQIILIISAIAAILLLIIGYIFSSKIAESLKSASSIMAKIADGNLDIEVDNSYLKRKDEIGNLLNSIDYMLKSLTEIVSGVKSNSSSVVEASSQLSKASDELGLSSEEIAKSVTSVAEQSSEISNEVNNLEAISDDLDHRSSDLINNVDVSLDVANNSLEMAESGNESINEAIDQLDIVKETVNFATDAIEKLGRRSEEIGEMVDMIEGIANQTNLLALNAAIEAARASEHGAGFAVVADEVRQLAEESSKVAGQITSLIEDIQSETKATVNSMDTNIEQVEKQIKVINKAGDSLKKIVNSSEVTKEKVNEIKAFSSELQQQINLINKSIYEIGDSTENNAANSQEVSALAEEQSASVQEVAASSDELENMANQLNSLVSEFNV